MMALKGAYLRREAIRGQQRQVEASRGNQRQSDAIRWWRGRVRDSVEELERVDREVEVRVE
jgi:hypothetical protein